MMALAERWYSRVFLAATLLLALLALAERPLSPAATLLLLAVAVLLFGLPHGALDPQVADQAFAACRGYSAPAFYLGYLALVVLYGLLWVRLPTLGLSLFLLLAAVHFGSDWQPRGAWLVRCAYGCAIVTLPALRFPAEVTSIYTLLGAAHAATLVAASRAFAPLALATAILGACLQLRRRPSDSLELLTLVAGALCLHPLVYFAAYFALLHSPRHLLETAASLHLTSLREVYRLTLPVVAATVLLGAMAYALLPRIGLDARLLRVIFIGLAALTVPHMLLDGFAAARQRGSLR